MHEMMVERMKDLNDRLLRVSESLDESAEILRRILEKDAE